jgi:hypothetical protein
VGVLRLAGSYTTEVQDVRWHGIIVACGVDSMYTEVLRPARILVGLLAIHWILLPKTGRNMHLRPLTAQTFPMTCELEVGSWLDKEPVSSYWEGNKAHGHSILYTMFFLSKHQSRELRWQIPTAASRAKYLAA